MKRIIISVIAGCMVGCLLVGVIAVISPVAVNETETTTETVEALLLEEETGAPETSPVEEETVTLLSEDTEAQLEDICKMHYARAVQVAVIEDGRIADTYNYGWADYNKTVAVSDETTYRIASLSKLVTDIVFMKLCQLGKCSPDGDIGDYLGYTVRNPYYPDTVITPAMLMCHTSSVQDSATFENAVSYCSIPLENLLSYRSSFSANEPGTYYNYSNFGVAVIGAICESVTGEHFNDLAKKFIFEPMGLNASYESADLDESLIGYLSGTTLSMQNATLFSDEIGESYNIVQGGLHISARDYAEILCMLINDGVASNGRKILKKSSVEQMLSTGFETEDYTSCFGVEVYKNLFGRDTVYLHTGSAYGMYSCYAFTDDGDGVVVLSSGADGSYYGLTEIYSICYMIIDELL